MTDGPSNPTRAVPGARPAGPPAKIGRYEIVRELGRGMMGVVYEALDPALGRTIAVKTIELAFAVSAAEREGFEQRFFAEARAAARLSHPGVLVVHDVGRDPDTGLLFIALEYLKGRTLAEAVADGAPLEWREALRIVQRVAEALQHAHAEGVVHRDIKPANIMLLPDGGTKIMDFGIAKFESAAGGLTSTGQFFGTPVYMSPEQALEQKVDGRADLFSLGATAYTLLTGRLAFGAENFVAIIGRVTRHDPVPPSRVIAGLPRDVDYVVARALAKAPADRYPKARMLAEDVDDILAGRPSRHRAAWTPPAPAEGTVLSTLSAPPPGNAGLRPGVPPPPSARLASPHAAPPRAALPRGGGHTGPSSTGRPWRALLAAALLGAAAAALVIVRMTPTSTEPSLLTTEQPAAPTAVSALLPPDTPTTPPEPTTAPTPSVVETQPPATPKPQRRSSRPAVEASPAVQPAVEAAPTLRSAALAIDFEHPLKEGTLRVFLDNALLLEERLESRAKKVVGLTLRKGNVRRVFSVPPGEHYVRVEVLWDDQKKTATLWGNLETGATRTLEIRMLQVLKKLSVEWK